LEPLIPNVVTDYYNGFRVGIDDLIGYTYINNENVCLNYLYRYVLLTM